MDDYNAKIARKGVDRLTQAAADLGAIPGGRPPFTNRDTLFRFLGGKSWEMAFERFPAETLVDEAGAQIGPGGDRSPKKRAFIPLADGSMAQAVCVPGSRSRPGSVPEPDGWILAPAFRRWEDERDGLRTFYASSLQDGYRRLTRRSMEEARRDGTLSFVEEKLTRDAYMKAVYGGA